MLKDFLSTKHAMLAVFLGLTACGDDDDTEPQNQDKKDEHNLEEEGCEHRENGPFETATAASDKASAPSAELEHHDVAVTLADVGQSQKGGFIKFAADEAGEFVLYLDKAVGITLRDAQDAAVTFEESVSTIETCPSLLAVYHVMDLEVGTYVLEFTASSENTVHVVLAPASGEGHGHEHERGHEHP